MEHICTPIDASRFGAILRETNYPEDKIKFIEEGFSQGFPLGYVGPDNVKQTSENLKLRIGDKFELWNKVMEEVGEKRFARPFEQIPFKDSFIQSPIGLVPKDGGKKTRLIFHLSHPRSGGSVNAGIPVDLCKVRYPEFDQAVKMCIEAGENCMMGKSDMALAFRHVPLKIKDFRYLVMKAEHPVTGRIYYFVDKCLPFGSSISCSHFQTISNAIAHVVAARNKKATLNYLDDFFFVALLKWLCNSQINTFLEVCKEIKFPVALEKTYWGTTVLVFLGLLLDSERQLVCIPKKKLTEQLN